MRANPRTPTCEMAVFLGRLAITQSGGTCSSLSVGYPRGVPPIAFPVPTAALSPKVHGERTPASKRKAPLNFGPRTKLGFASSRSLQAIEELQHLWR